MTLNLDGAMLQNEIAVLEYTLPAPFGPKGGEAFIRFNAKPATAQNPAYKAEMETVIRRARKKDLQRNKRHEKSKNDDQFLKAQEDDMAEMLSAVNAVNYDYCIDSWETNLQNGGKDLKTTKENFLALCDFVHPDVVECIRQFRDDITDLSNWQAEVEKALEGEETKNS